MYPSLTPPLDRGHCPRHFAGVEEGFTKWEEVLLIVNICDSTSVQFNGLRFETSIPYFSVQSCARVTTTQTLCGSSTGDYPKPARRSINTKNKNLQKSQKVEYIF